MRISIFMAVTFQKLVPFVICRHGHDDVSVKSKQMALAFELPYVLTVSKPVQQGKGSSSYAAAAEKGVPSILAEAGGVGQMQEDAVALLVQGVVNVMRHLGMIDGAADCGVESFYRKVDG